MKSRLNKLLIAILIILILFEFVFKFNISYATSSNTSTLMSPDTITIITNMSGGLISILYWPRRIAITGIAFLIDHAFLGLALTEDQDLKNSNNAEHVKYLTPFQIFFNKYKLLDVNVLDLASISERNQVVYPIRKNVSIWFHITRLISAIILLAILVYVGIRMAISTIASDRARYKKMFIDWFISLILIFAIPYICVAIININELVVKALETISSDMVKLDRISDIYNRIAVLATLGIGIPSITATIVYCAMVFMTIGFFIAYINRMIKVAFLVIISPLISITYSIDKMKDQKAQAFETWMKEFIYTVLIQPFHCIMYLAFTNTAYRLLEPFMVEGDGYLNNIIDLGAAIGDMAKKSILLSKDFNLLATAILVIISLVFIRNAEEVVRKIFGFSDTNKSTSFGAGLAMSVMAVSQAKNIGTATRKGVNNIKNFVPDFLTKGIPQDAALFGDKLKNTGFGQFASKTATSIGKAIDDSSAMKGIDNALSAISNSKAANVIGDIGGKVGGTIKGAATGARGAVYTVVNGKPLSKLPLPKFIRNVSLGGYLKKNSVASIVGSMYGISQLVGGNNALEIYADSKAVEEGVNAFNATGEKKLSDYSEDAIFKILRDKYYQKSSNYKKLGNNRDKDPAEEAIEELKQKYSEITSEESFRKKAVDEMLAYNQSYSERAVELRQKAEKLKAEGNAELEQAENDTNSSTTNAKLDEAKNLEKEAERLEEFAKVEEILAQRDSLETFWSLESLTEMIADMQYAPSSSDFKKARNELKEEILKLIQERKSENGEGDTVDQDDYNVAKVLENSIEEILENSVGADENVNMNKLLNNILSVSQEDDPSRYSQIMKKVNSLNTLFLEKKAAEPFEYLSKVNDDSGEYSDLRFSMKSARGIRDKYLSKRRKI